MVTKKARKTFCLFSLLIILSLLTGCATTHLQYNGTYARNESFLQKVKTNAIRAATSPRTWVPLTGALIIYSTNSDYQISKWASSTNPIFGSQKRADDFSDICVAAARDAFVVSSILDITSDYSMTSLNTNIQRFIIGAGALQLNTRFVTYLKTETGRLRPDASDYRSYPSGHTAESSINTTLASRNISYLRIPTPYKKAMQYSLFTLTTATAWARVEANKHYPSDVLVGMAIGNFLGSFIHGTFLDYRYGDKISFETDPIRNRLQMNLCFPF